MKIRSILLRVFGGCLLVSMGTMGAIGQNQIVVRAQMDSAAIMMGDQTTVHLEVSQDKGKFVRMPIIQDTLVAGVEVLKISKPDTVDLKNNRIQITNEVLVTSFDSGLYYLPPFKYVIDNDTFETQSLSLKVVPVPVDTTHAEFDIKTVDAPPFVLWDYVPVWVLYLLIALVVIAAGIYAYWRWGRKAKEGETVDETQKIPPYDRAMQALHELKDSKLWQQGQEKAYYTTLTEILRVYIDQRFHINAMEMTSTQIIDTLRRNEETKAVNQQLRDILAMADFVKFAKMRPLPDDNEQVMRYAETFVEETKPEEPAPEADADKKEETSAKTE
ncbi:DUF4381 family protein [Barnesiella sp. An55]|uniref:DUF4381 family protein n=1 Tax=Barnesiella sp. An55 TaxID=1965646 RepID=UPI000B39F8DD|nr:DUF4381 family protein [Barnesiella sp. An55]OUN74808.1 cell wall anchor protein [Barnesiella sp. An55]HIZ26330.1 DUF4381 family protein [Candidatus Barnesiella merdipullorum]